MDQCMHHQCSVQCISASLCSALVLCSCAPWLHLLRTIRLYRITTILSTHTRHFVMAAPATLDTYQGLVGAFADFLIAAIHTILYERGIYPRESFLSARKYNF